MMTNTDDALFVFSQHLLANPGTNEMSSGRSHMRCAVAPSLGHVFLLQYKQQLLVYIYM